MAPGTSNSVSAPVMRIDGVTYGRLTPDKARRAIADFLALQKKGPAPARRAGVPGAAAPAGEIRIGVGSCCVAGGSLRVMEELAHEGATMIVVSHEMAFAREAADRVLFLQDGQVLEEGPPEVVLDAPQHEATRLFLRRVLGARDAGPVTADPDA